MNRYTLILFLSLALIGKLSAQTKTFLGFRGGAQVSTAFIAHTIFPTNLDTDFITTSHFGLVVKHFNFKAINKVGINAGLQTGLNYIQRGWKQNFTDTENLDPYTIRLDYLELPLEAILYGGKGNTKVFGTLGIYYERLINNVAKNTPDPNFLGRDDFYTYDRGRDPENGYGARLSFGVFSAFPFGTLQLEAFSSVSFSGVFNFGDRTTRIPDLANPYSIGLSVAYFFEFGDMEF